MCSLTSICQQSRRLYKAAVPSTLCICSLLRLLLVVLIQLVSMDQERGGAGGGCLSLVAHLLLPLTCRAAGCAASQSNSLVFYVPTLFCTTVSRSSACKTKSCRNIMHERQLCDGDTSVQSALHNSYFNIRGTYSIIPNNQWDTKEHGVCLSSTVHAHSCKYWPSGWFTIMFYKQYLLMGHLVTVCTVRVFAWLNYINELLFTQGRFV